MDRGIVVIGLVENWGKRKYNGKRGGYWKKNKKNKGLELIMKWMNM